MQAIIADDEVHVLKLLTQAPALATEVTDKSYLVEELEHDLSPGDTALHIASAGYRRNLVGELITKGADANAKNKRGATPLHYAVDGGPGQKTWNPTLQAATISWLIRAGADANALDKNGMGPLHKAVKNRSAAAVRALLVGGCNPKLKNTKGVTPIQLAKANSERGGSGDTESKVQEAEITRLLIRHGGRS